MIKDLKIITLFLGLSSGDLVKIILDLVWCCLTICVEGGFVVR